ncbi:branched-chain amino acid ABC transporter permease [Agrobacterium tumefaciens]|uniref:branched-chain amino acid ABC transporter permease n=1 Tax=Agrobacterium tumefaciens TaxID=358 RepID=UPI001574304C|nr:branched-chain amino acid ABC transporter permease [Agrobacterium tumefaciens]NTC82581.1 branched-chain amino acid ABC transporter permease [Agrobacterium tumefaciens]NTD11404.1 branched-chain amino acid ABC transporter permease [Agrobacterium tumefaciens]NTD86725.1 branched-chain amino acid ABC transporter permease [Agrobacterium tumefaciens]NTD91452.1 branched-chain amino acid ABC transporter permease [Agrobacterium tumefaciens]NTD96923.1 branched-chain amino acid ABC transporter permease
MTMNIFSSRLTPLVMVVAIIIVVPLIAPSNYYLRLASLVSIFALTAIGLNLLMGYAGQVSLGHAGFMGIGAYSVALAPVHLGVHSIAGGALGALASCLLAWTIGRPILRLKGYYLAMGTLACGMLIWLVLSNASSITGGPDGMNVERVQLGAYSLRGVLVWYWITAVALVIGMVLAINLLHSSTGRALRSIHDSEIAATVSGIDVAKQKSRVFVISAAYASVSGSLLALVNGQVTPDSTAGFLRSIEVVTMVVLGGMGSIGGSIVGAAFMVLLPQILTVFHDYEHMILGLIMMACMILLRNGIVPTLIAKFRGQEG